MTASVLRLVPAELLVDAEISDSVTVNGGDELIFDDVSKDNDGFDADSGSFTCDHDATLHIHVRVCTWPCIRLCGVYPSSNYS